jgi:hypothetical protein
MAEIKIEKKKPLLPWMLLVGILAVLAYFLVFNDGKDVKKTTETSSLINVRENNSAVAAFVRFVEVESKDMALNHAYTNEALLKLTEATNAMAGEIKYDVTADMDQVKKAANVITKDKFDTSHANSIRDATNILTNALEKMQQAKYPELAKEAAELRSASDSIKPDVLTLDQKDNIKTFFSKAADLLKKMN